MSRSFRKYPFCNGSASWGKRRAARVLRHRINQIVSQLYVNLTWRDQSGIHDEPRRVGCPVIIGVEDALIPLKDEIYDYGYDNGSTFRFDPERNPDLLRK